MKPVKTRIAYLAPITGLSMVHQDAMADAAGCGWVYRYGKDGDGLEARRRWIDRLGPETEAWVPDLRVLITKPKDRAGVKPSADLTAVFTSILATRSILAEGVTGLRSTDGAPWRHRMAWVYDRVWSAHRSQRRVNEQTANMRAKKPIGVVALWRSAAMKAKREALARIWRDPHYRTEHEARAALPEPFCDMSIMTARRVFGDRLPAKRKPKR